MPDRYSERPNLKGHLSRREVVCPSRENMPMQPLWKPLRLQDLIRIFQENEAGILYGNDSSSIPVIEAMKHARSAILH